MRGQPDLLFWRIDCCDEVGAADCISNKNNDKGSNDIDANNDDNRNKYNCDNNNNNNKSNNNNNNDNNNNNNSNKRNLNVDIITTHTVFAVEVKSSSDQLSEWQIAWFNLLNHAGIYVEKLHVRNA